MKPPASESENRATALKKLVESILRLFQQNRPKQTTRSLSAASEAASGVESANTLCSMQIPKIMVAIVVSAE